MRKLRIFAHITLDGVIQHSDDGDGFPYSDWSAPFRTPAGRDALLAAQGERFDLLLGRRTYDLWSGFWPQAPASPMADSLRAATKFIVTHRPETLTWGPSESLGPELAADVRRLKARPGPDLILWGSSTLTSELLGHGLVEELLLVTYPLLLGTGKRLLAEGSASCRLALLSTQAMPSGVCINKYRPA